jgi:fructose-1,6-bisphosphatase
MHQGRATLSKFLIQQLKGTSEQSDLAALLVDIAAAVKAISAMTAKGELGGVLGSLDSTNIQGETQKKLDVMSDTAFINTFSMGGLVAGLASEENDHIVEIDPKDGSGRFLAVFDPLDGS